MVSWCVFSQKKPKTIEVLVYFLDWGENSGFCELVSTYKYLGLSIDSCLSMEQAYKDINQKMNGRFKHYVDPTGGALGGGGGSSCPISILRNGHVAISILRNAHVAISILKDMVMSPYRFQEMLMSPIDFEK